MARIGIYNEPFGASLGGSEYLVTVLAEMLSKSHEVELVHHRALLTASELEEFSGRDLSNVNLRYVEPKDYEFGSSHNPWRRYQDARNWQVSLSEPYDLFVASLHNVPPFCHARSGVLILLFPLYFRPYTQSQQSLPPDQNSLWRTLSRGYHKWEWQKRMDSYQTKTAISHFTQIWAKRRWNIDCQLIYPPVETDFIRHPKLNMILSIGRFAIEGEGHSKRQREMLEVFRTRLSTTLTDWEYFSVGNVGSSIEHKAFFDELVREGAESHAQLQANLKRSEVRHLLQRAKIFWHAAGYGEAEDSYPELAEHFGIVTVEAMAAGCVPVVINKGGQKEIVEHGVSGFLCENLEEFSEYTLLLASDEALREQMSEAARIRAQMFSAEVFQEKFWSLLEPLISTST